MLHCFLTDTGPFLLHLKGKTTRVLFVDLSRQGNRSRTRTEQRTEASVEDGHNAVAAAAAVFYHGATRLQRRRRGRRGNDAMPRELLPRKPQRAAAASAA